MTAFISTATIPSGDLGSPDGRSTASPLAAWDTRRPWLWGAALSVGGLLLTAVGAGIAQAGGRTGAAPIWTITGFVALSAAIGLLVMARSRPSLSDYGFRRPQRLARIGWGLPLLLIPPLVAGTAGLHVTRPEAVAYAALTVAVGCNEEIWFRGLAQAALRGLGDRRAVIAGALIFGALHLVNAAGGKGPLYLLLQAVFAAEVGLVLATIVLLTRSLWVGIGWHFVYDFTAYCTGDTLTRNALIGVVIMMGILGGYAGWLWRQPVRPGAA